MTLISFDVHIFCFCDDDGDADDDDDGDDDNDDEDDIAIVHGLKTMFFQTWGCFIRVLHGIALYCVVLHCILKK